MWSRGTIKGVLIRRHACVEYSRLHADFRFFPGDFYDQSSAGAENGDAANGAVFRDVFR